MSMREPPYPGQSVRYDCIEAVGLTVTKAAKVLGVTRQALNNVVTCRAGISPEMAIRMDEVFGVSAEAWLSLQIEYDLAQGRKSADNIAVRRYVPPRGEPKKLVLV